MVAVPEKTHGACLKTKTVSPDIFSDETVIAKRFFF
jgi:hypothetical protein